MIKQFYLTHRWDPNKYYHSRSHFWTNQVFFWKMRHKGNTKNCEMQLWKCFEKMVWFGCVLWHINPCELFDAESSLHTQPHTCTGVYIILENNLLETLFSNKPELICLHTVKWFQVLLFIVCTLLYVLLLNTNNSTQYYSFVYIHLNDFKHSYVILFGINDLFAHS